MPQFTHTVDVGAYLRPPEAPADAIGKIVQENANWITGPVNDFLQQLTGRDLASDLQDLIVGDWTCVYRLRDAVGSSAQALSLVQDAAFRDTLRLREDWSGNAAEAFVHFMGMRHGEIEKVCQALVDLREIISRTIKGLEDLCAILVSRLNDLSNAIAGAILIAGVGGLAALAGGAAAGPFGAAAAGIIGEVITGGVWAVYLIYDTIKTLIGDIPKAIEAWQIGSEVKTNAPNITKGLDIGKPYGGPENPY
ncbi:WXG100 family type VII secretion target [Saccharopolyspora taberi]|uniref:WXG100 family type VII secretion target n=1 Tax=Saccharopolyspora taberi TaxID=60895 RepID=A0ABN3UZZ8_9PSEU